MLRNNGDTRSGFERRKYTSDIHIPERRSEKDRRQGQDLRKIQVQRGQDTVPRRKAFMPSAGDSAVDS